MPEGGVETNIPGTPGTPGGLHNSKPVFWALAVIAVLVMGALFLAYAPNEPVAEQPALGDVIRRGEAPRPAVTPENTIAALSQKAGFQALVSYTDLGFEPPFLSVKLGDTVRFTNNSSNPVRFIMPTGDMSLVPQRFADVPFDAAGEIVVTVDGDSAKSTTVRVE